MSLLRSKEFNPISCYIWLQALILSTQNIFARRKPPTVEHSAPCGAKTNCILHHRRLLCFLFRKKCHSIIAVVTFIMFKIN